MVALSEGAAASAEADPPRAASVMRQVADTGREALTGMRRMLGVLGGEAEEAALAPQPTAAELPRLVARFRELGLPVAYEASGEVPADPAFQLAVHRIVQEGLTNALRYSQGPTRVEVRVDATGEQVDVSVDDDGLPGIPAPSVGAGRGLIGLTERVSALGGTLTSGHHDSGTGWRLATALPRKESS
jgi:signal transduction histidine kinase